MERLRVLPIVLALGCAVAGSAPVFAQGGQEPSPAEPQQRSVRVHAPRPMPFLYDTGKQQGASSIEFHSFEQMAEKDRDLAADAEASIGERAGFAGLEFNEGSWSYRQLVCPALPNHLFLQFTGNNGRGDVSEFSASIPRGGTGRVRIIPIQRRGYSLFSPAPVNSLTISAFNHIRTEEEIKTTSDWLGTALCYAALAGAHPQAAPPMDAPEMPKAPAAPPTVLEILQRGGAEIRFTDVAAAPRPMEWTLTFDGAGKLLKASHAPASLEPLKTSQAKPVDVRGKLVSPATVDLRGKQIP
jgi:hypothetical protein